MGRKQKDLRLMNSKGRLEIYDEIKAISDRSVGVLVEDIVVKGEECALKAMGVMAGMIPEAVETVYDIMRFGEGKDQVRLKSAMFVLGVFGVGEKKQIEISDKRSDKRQLLEELKDEFRRQIERAQFTRAKGDVVGVEAGAVLVESG